jgi:hypothetical protein
MQRVDEVLALACDAAAPFVSANVRFGMTLAAA